MPAAIGDRSALTWTTIAPFGVLRVTVRVWPAGSAGGWLVGQLPFPTTAADGRLDALGLAAALPGAAKPSGSQEQEAADEDHEHDQAAGQQRQPGDAARDRAAADRLTRRSGALCAA